MSGGAGRVAIEIPQGLTSVEAAARLARDGQNLLPPPRPVPLWHRIATQLRDPLVLVLLVAAVLTIATGDWTDASVILLVIVVNTSVGVIQEVKAGQAIAALTQLAAPEARVLRDGKQRPVPAADVVGGDRLGLAQGDILPAHATVVGAAVLPVDALGIQTSDTPQFVAYRFADRQTRASFYVEDEWTPLKPLTINFGLRFDHADAAFEHEPEVRLCYFGAEHGIVETPIRTRQELSQALHAGPLIVEDMDSTIVVPPGASCRLDGIRNVVITWPAKEER